MLIGFVLLVVLAIIAVGGWDKFKALLQPNSSPQGGGPAPDQPDQSPEAILRERYARGEISREEFLEAQQTLGS